MKNIAANKDDWESDYSLNRVSTELIDNLSFRGLSFDLGWNFRYELHEWCVVI